MVVRQYPYTLQVLQLTGGGFDGDGNPIPSIEEYVEYANCRDEANSGGNQINLVDGSAHVFDSLIQLPKGPLPIDVGSRIRVMEENVVRVKGTVKRFQKDQLHSRLWV
ncbi:hypothetical protein DYBT9623_04413 [Dyadobacter sp. CECT 9623]|uniref:Uncharacterized protein n=1 Tax=Dyadobacter linearis TaxID=2823330 RepID=A0ABN7RCC8_9BACT|nr:hypothetical protein [Dyadobacter sp. CECT 9623]CAG5072873.1 hypothetical protein DYBT9623_04413 [Dyadobacter sp. CECT 9623]